MMISMSKTLRREVEGMANLLAAQGGISYFSFDWAVCCVGEFPARLQVLPNAEDAADVEIRNSAT